MSLNKLLVGLVAFFAVGALALWAASHLAIKEVDHVIPPSRMVQADPFYALARVFSPTLKVVRYRDAAKISVKNAVFFAVNGRELSGLNEEAVVKWVAQGGRLLIYFVDPSALPRASWWRGPFEGLAPRFGKRPAASKEQPNRRRASTRDSSRRKGEILIDDRVSFPEAVPGKRTSVVVHDGAAYAVVRRWGRGLVILSGEPYFLMNGNLKEAGDLRFTSSILGGLLSRPGGAVVLPEPGVPPALEALHIDAGPVLLALLALIALLVWMRSPRLGPVLPESAADTRSLRVRFRAEGRFLWRYGAGDLIEGHLRSGRSLYESSPDGGDASPGGPAPRSRRQSREKFSASVAEYVSEKARSRDE